MEFYRALDALIAESVMGLKNVRIEPRSEGEKVGLDYHSDPPPGPVYQAPVPVPEYSTDIKDAWQILEKYKSLEPSIAWNDETKTWVCVFKKAPESSWPLPTSQSAAEAICLSVLELFGVNLG